MYGGLARFVVKPGMRAEFLEFLRWDAKVAKDTEPGTLRFDVWETELEPGVVYVDEAYKTQRLSRITRNTNHLRNSTRSCVTWLKNGCWPYPSRRALFPTRTNDLMAMRGRMLIPAN